MCARPSAWRSRTLVQRVAPGVSSQATCANTPTSARARTRCNAQYQTCWHPSSLAQPRCRASCAPQTTTHLLRRTHPFIGPSHHPAGYAHQHRRAAAPAWSSQQPAGHEMRCSKRERSKIIYYERFISSSDMFCGGVVRPSFGSDNVVVSAVLLGLLRPSNVCATCCSSL